VIIAAYQAAKTVGEAVASALEQKLAPHEVIVCDDGSTDDIKGALAPYGERVTLIHLERNSGPSAARNAAIRLASGDFVSVLDADDVYLPGRLEALAEVVSARPDLGIITTDAYLDLGDETLRRAYDESWPFEVADQRRAILERNFIIGVIAVRRSILLDVGGYDESLRWVEDWDLCLRLIFAGFGAGLVCEPLARYRLNPKSLTTFRANMRRSEVTMLEKAAAAGLPLDAHERETLEASLVQRRLAADLEETREALANGAADARRQAGAIAIEQAYGPMTRVKAAAGALSPGLVRRLLRQRRRRAWIGGGGLRVENPRP
jgi:glycosyltransferase involved in cell wall biosynthesis